MLQAKLLTVEASFQIHGVGLVVVPDFSVPTAGWKNGTHRVQIVLPTGGRFDTTASIHVWHFNISDPAAPLDKRWRGVIAFPELTKEQLPVGSEVFGDPTIAETLSR